MTARSTKGIAVFVGGLVLVDLAFYAAILPLLPGLVDEFGLSRAGAGLLAGAYPAGALTAAIPSGWIAMRIGLRRGVLLGLLLMAAASLGVAFASSAELVVAARFVQGAGSAVTWGAGMAWLVTVTPADRRGTAIASAISASAVGAVIGPPIGALAAEVGRDVVFSGALIVFGALALTGLRLHAPATGTALTTPLRAMGDRTMLVGVVVIAAICAGVGAMEVIGALRLDGLGGSPALIATVFLAAAALVASFSWLGGWLTDRYGSVRAIRWCLVIAVLALVISPLPQGLVGLAVVLPLALGLVQPVLVPASTVLTERAEQIGLPPALAFAIFSFAWTTGFTGGTLLAGVLSDLAGDPAPLLVCAGLLATVAVFVFLDRGSMGSAHSATAHDAVEAG